MNRAAWLEWIRSGDDPEARRWRDRGFGTDPDIANTKRAETMRATLARPEVREKLRAAQRAAWARPEVREKLRAALARPEVREKRRAALARPEVREKLRAAAIRSRFWEARWRRA